MKVRELQNFLNQLDPELHLVCYSEDEALKLKNGFPLSFEILHIQAKECTLTRLPDESSSIIFGVGPYSSTLAIMAITADV